MKYQYPLMAACAACCLFFLAGCSHNSASTPKSATGGPTVAGATTPPPNTAAIANKLISDLQALPPAQRQSYMGKHQSEVMMAMMNPSTRAQIQSLLNQH